MPPETFPRIPNTTKDIFTLIGEPLDVETMEEASRSTITLADEIRISCSVGIHCLAVANRDQFGDGINLARLDSYYVGCDKDNCPLITQE